MPDQPSAIDLDADGLDLIACDVEPIHVPGSIQPHGWLLLVDAARHMTVAGAGNLETLFGPEWLNQPVESVLGSASAAAMKSAGETCRLGTVEALGLDAVAIRSGDLWLVQLEQPTGTATPFDALSWLEEVGFRFERAVGLAELFERAAEAYRELTGFDRVMIYRFLDDDSGVVVAEAAAAGQEAFRNHHFPASDIPKQARALYVRNRVRAIPDVSYVPQPIRPADFAGVDLSDVDLRSISPTHVQYLKNMGVAASASVSIVRNGVLWGLIACHNMTPRPLGAAERRAAQILAGGLARQIGAKEQAEEYRASVRVRADEDAVLWRIGAARDVEALLVEASSDLTRMFDADGFAVLHGQSLHLDGACPDRDDVREIAAWARDRGAEPFSSNSLERDFPPAAEYRERASGLLSVTLSSKVPTVLLWFRAEARELVDWAGNPHKAATLAPGERLTPRASFEAWTQEVRGRARAWTAAELEAANRLQTRLYEARANRRMRDLADELGIAVADKDRLLAQKDTLLKEVNHRVQNSLQLVTSFLNMQARAENDETLTRHLNEAQRRLAAVALVHRRLYADDNVRSVDLARYLGELVGELKTSMGIEWADQVTLDLAPILIASDDAIQVGLVLVELVINAQKYAYDGAPGPIAIGLERHRARFRLIVADQGRGRTGTRKGFGTRMLDAMVQRLSGIMEESDNRPGLRVVISAPASVTDGNKAEAERTRAAASNLP